MKICMVVSNKIERTRTQNRRRTTMRLLPFIFNLIIGTFAKYTSDDEDLYGGSGDYVVGSGDEWEGSGDPRIVDPETAVLDTTWLLIGAGALTSAIVICSIVYCCCIRKK